MSHPHHSPQSISALLGQVLSISEPQERALFLSDLSEEIDPATLEELKSLLTAFNDADPLLEHPFFIQGTPRPSASQVAPSTSLPCSFGTYTLVSEIGRGGMGVIYQATEEALARTVALKMIRDVGLASRTDVLRFYAEAQAAAGLNHPGIVPVYEAGEIGGQHYFTMGFVPGINLSKAIDENTLESPQKIQLVQKITEAISYAHGQGVIHRDLKPENILLTRANDHSPYHPQITDFGLAKRFDQNENLTLSGQLLGTPGYMAPEQLSGKLGTITERTDIYAIGALIYHLFSGRPPHQEDTLWQTLIQASKAEPESLKSRAPEVPADLDIICHTCLEKDPQKRYPTTTELLLDLENLQHKRPLKAKRASLSARILKFIQRHPAPTLAGLLALSLITLSIFLPVKHARELLKKNLTLATSSKETEQALQQAVKAQAHSQLNLASLLASRGNINEALKSYLKAAQLARQGELPDLETLARYNIGTFGKHLWTLKNTLSIDLESTYFKFAPDNKTIAFITWAGQVRVLHPKYGHLLPPSSLSKKATAIAFHPNGQSLAIGQKNGSIHFFQLKQNKFHHHRTLNPSSTSEAILQLGYHSQGHSFHTIQETHGIHTWDLKPDRIEHIRQISYEGSYRDSSVALDKDILALFTKKGTITGWNLVTGETLFGPIHTQKKIQRGYIDSAGERIFAVHKENYEGQIYRIIPPTLEPIGPIGHQSSIKHAFFGSNSHTLITSSSDRVLQFHDSNTLSTRSLPLKFNRPVNQFSLNRQEHSLYTLHHHDGKIAHWQAPEIWNQLHQESHSLPDYKPLTLSSHGEIIGRTNDALIRTTLHEKSQPEPQPFTSSKKLEILAHPKDQSLILVDRGKSPFIKILDDTTLETRWSEEKEIPQAHEIALSHDGRYLALVTVTTKQGPNQAITIIDLKSGQRKMHRIKSYRIRTIAFSTQTSDQVIFSSNRNSLIWFDWKTGRQIDQKFHGKGTIYYIDTDPEQNLIAIGSSNRIASVYHEATWEKVTPDMLHDDRVGLVHFIKGTQFFISGGKSNRAFIRDLKTGLVIGPSLTHQSRIAKILTDSSTNTIITFSTTGEIKRWPSPTLETRSFEEIEKWLKTNIITQF